MTQVAVMEAKTSHDILIKDLEDVYNSISEVSGTREAPQLLLPHADPIVRSLIWRARQIAPDNAVIASLEQAPDHSSQPFSVGELKMICAVIGKQINRAQQRHL